MSTAGAAQATRLLSSAERALSIGDFSGAKRHAERAIDLDPLVDGVDEILAVADVLLAAKSRVNGHPNWYAVLHLPSLSPSPADVSRSYRRLTLLLNPTRNPNPKADAAARLVADAYAVLSDPSKKSLFDAELRAAAGDSDDDDAGDDDGDSVQFEPFWTACVSCFRVHLYDREYLNRSIRCATCRRPFTAAELSMPPTIVPGTDTYYCSWGFYPLGYPGGPEFKCPEGVGVDSPNFGKEWNAFYPVVECSKPQSGEKQGNAAEAAKTGTGTTGKGTKRTKTVVRRNLRGGARKAQGERRKVTDADDGAGSSVGAAAVSVGDAVGVALQASALRPVSMGEEFMDDGGLNVSFSGHVNNQARGPVGGVGGVGGHVGGVPVAGNVGAMPFQIDMDPTNEILRNYHNINFL